MIDDLCLTCFPSVPVRVVVVDYDGTLADGAEEDAASMRALRESPYRVVLATGRGLLTARPLAERMGARDIISLGGAQVNGPGLSWTAPPVPAAVAGTIVGVSEAERCAVRLHTAESGPAVVGVEVATPTARVLDVVRDLASRNPSLSVVCAIDAAGVPLVTATVGADKGSGLSRLQAHYGVGTAETVAFCDGENDASLPNAALTVVAVGAAHPALLRRATHRAAMGPRDEAVRRGLAWLAGEPQPVVCLRTRGCAPPDPKQYSVARPDRPAGPHA